MKRTVASFIVAGAVLIAPLTSEAALGDQLLRQGMQHEDVRELQVELRDLGKMQSSADSIFGPLTREAVIKFQSARGLTVDGIVGPETVGALQQNNESQVQTSSSSGDWDGNTLLRQGDRGAKVSALQTSLQQDGHYNSSIDGIFGPITAEAVRSLQRNASIAVDGIAGPQTYAAINGTVQVSSSNNSTQSSSSSSNTSSSSNVESLVSDAKQQIGAPYSWGGTTPSGFDSSGYIVYVFAQNGIDLSRTHREYYHEGTSVSSPSRGDVVFFQTYLDAPSHAGIYLGDNTFIHNSSSQGVIITSMDNSYWSPRYIGAKRYIN
ncbi:C40 family peptidase [Salisediminibacterium beveridgei]|uniref:Cell wall lytic activity n=1 Tax=Salisediminibacterium beveridgei TaxID=632773 RepID=A0A1D7QZ17_9BACI|nr:peptidoglycan-binding protein [Salisediminibacterium beveridgei]AOM84249.1 cell wall lytic activity [Salisediminibacterium beveridgei]